MEEYKTMEERDEEEKGKREQSKRKIKGAGRL